MPKTEQRGTQLASIISMDMSGGVQSKTVPALSHNNQLLHILNGNIDRKLGGISGRHGSVVKNATSKEISYFGVYRNGATRKHFIVASDGSNEVIYTVPTTNFSGTLTAVLSGHFTDDSKIHSTTFATSEMFFNGLNDPKQTSDFSTFTTITNAPVAGKYPEVFQQRLYVLGTDGFLHYSDVINASGNGFSSDTWTNRGINPNDGQETKALVRHRGKLVIFKTESIYRYDGSNEPEPIINVGTHSERGVVKTDTMIFFHHQTEIYKMSLGDPTIISRPVEKYIKGADKTYWTKVSSGKDASNVYFSIGDVTISDPLEWDNGRTYNNVVLVYNFLLDRWTVWSGIAAEGFFTNSDDGALYFFDASGNISAFDESVWSDGGKAIDFQLLWHPISYGVPHLKKAIDRIIIDGRGDLRLRAGSRQDNMEALGKFDEESKTTQIKQRISFNKLWVGVDAKYENTPPFVEQLYIGNAYVGNQP